jgi:hypothetical protein
MLRVRDPRITASSLAVCCETNNPASDTSAIQRSKAAIAEEDACSWKRAAKRLAVTVADVQNLIANGQLKLVDTFVTDRAFEDFCRKHGNEINMNLIDPATRKWLMSEYGVSETADAKTVPRAQKHALVIRECKCGRKIAGNVYFRHVRHCRPADVRAMGKAV